MWRTAQGLRCGVRVRGDVHGWRVYSHLKWGTVKCEDLDALALCSNDPSLRDRHTAQTAEAAGGGATRADGAKEAPIHPEDLKAMVGSVGDEELALVCGEVDA